RPTRPTTNDQPTILITCSAKKRCEYETTTMRSVVLATRACSIFGSKWITSAAARVAAAAREKRARALLTIILPHPPLSKEHNARIARTEGMNSSAAYFAPNASTSNGPIPNVHQDRRACAAFTARAVATAKVHRQRGS